ncbi:hypothetical protein [Halochromatium glycolicum]|uniref:Uncharacterized protein n=1 Tax=Halochromatium glycolicum TaxID=85075 RepID=A0AAJ0U5J1_9GAMM|nr:hypothetical protein [Halochromatium glycolicum]MBK1705523.1 hypothetical protein [Halochromatium glycolicum]
MNEPVYAATLVVLEILFTLMLLAVLRSSGARAPLLTVIGSTCMLWLAGVYLLLANGFFSATGLPQLAFFLTVVLLTAIGFLMACAWRPLREVVDAISTRDVLRLQQMRAVFGVMFFFTAALPLWFQYLGGLGDIAAGIGAFLALRHLRTGSDRLDADRERRAIIGGNLVGILDFVVVLTLGVLIVLRDHSPDIAFDLIPLYVVPIFLLLHLVSLQRLTTLGAASDAPGRREQAATRGTPTVDPSA